MQTSYQVIVNDALELDISKDAIDALDSVDTATSKYHILQDDISYYAKIVEDHFSNKRYKIRINNHTYSIQIKDSLDQLIKDLGFEIGNSKKTDKIIAPMPGLILEISVKAGDEVKENDSLLILEAMKMENIISSPREGFIKTVSVGQGDAVEKNQLLIEFE